MKLKGNVKKMDVHHGLSSVASREKQSSFEGFKSLEN